MSAWKCQRTIWKHFEHKPVGSLARSLGGSKPNELLRASTDVCFLVGDVARPGLLDLDHIPPFLMLDLRFDPEENGDATLGSAAQCTLLGA